MQQTKGHRLHQPVRSLEQVEQTLQFQAMILANVQESVIVTDLQGKIIYWNEGAQRIFGYSASEMLGKTPALLYPCVEETNLQTDLQRVLAGTDYLGEWEGRRKNGSVVWVDIRTSLLRNGDAEPVGFLGLAKDITERKKTEETLREQEVKLHVNELKDQLLLHLSHEFRTPLAVVNGYLELLKGYHEHLDAPTQAAFLDKALASCNELTLLVNTILDAMQITNEMKPAKPEELVVAHVVHEVVDQFASQQEEHALQLDISEHVTAWADKHYLRQILRNLLSNALKYAPKQTPVTISAAVSEGARREMDAPAQVWISVADAGPGISPAELPQLFEKFVRLKRDMTGKVRGTGLGLYISKQLVEAMGGHIWVESVGRVGEGSRFCFTLPVAASAFRHA
jgi:PAS domain S-box-containing protein